MAVIDIGSPVIDRDSWKSYGVSVVCKENPANASGKITSVDIWMKSAGAVVVATFFREDPTGFPNHFTARDTQNIGTVASTVKQTIPVDLNVTAGDFIGFWMWASSEIEADGSGGEGIWVRVGDIYTWENEEFTFQAGWTISIGGIGINMTVTTQAVTDVLSTTATGNGNITYAGDNATRRGFCYMEGTEGDPTTANSVVYDDGDFGVGAFTKAITGLTKRTGYRVRAYAINPVGTYYGDTVQLTTIEEPTVTTQAVTNIGDVTAIGNGNITDLGGDPPTKRGICYNTTGSPTVADSKTEETGEFSVGAFTETLINLSPETHYYAKAYAMNAVGYGYGAEVEFTTRLVEYIGYAEDDDGWVKFITAAEGVIPTGTRKVICSDYTGYTYRTQASETDDGAEYVAYFVISTDLTPDKSSLAYYKRILDLHLYFKNEISGMVKVEVKRDSEPAWQEVGEVTLTGIEEILIKHLAPDIKAKHFLFKLSATNKFKFLGCLYEFLLEGDR